MNKMTPTPWHYEWDDNGFFFIHAPGCPSPYIVATGTGCDPGSICEANAEAIVSAVNNTYGIGVRPEIIEEMLNALLDLSDRCDKARKILQSPGSPSHGYWGMLDTERAKKAIEQSKL